MARTIEIPIIIKVNNIIRSILSVSRDKIVLSLGANERANRLAQSGNRTKTIS